uniref:Tensin-4 n=1 Tax=Magallana gigas TaxID=29159 RepID=K1PED9_MAGGI
MSIFQRWIERKKQRKSAKITGFVAKGSDIDENYVNTSISNNDGGKKWRLESLMGLDRSHIEDETLRHSSWYQAGIPREIALEILQQEEIGSFIVRDSSTHPGCYALSVRVPKFENPTGISHYLILKTQRGVKLKGLEKEWPDLLALVTHHTVMSEMLPCTLRLPHKSKNPAYKDSEDGKKEDDPDYQRLSDFTSMMAALKN